MDYYIIILIVLCLLAVTDLTVGVANDAVNFLNSGVGSHAASFKKILFVAALGVFIGVLFSSGMMDVAKTGIFNPQYYLLAEVLIIFVAVMFNDLLLLDLFNTFGLPTSTTVSVVAGMFGSALMITFIKLTNAGESLSLIATYLNVASLFKIFTAILLSIAFAFIFGFLVQYISRLIFTFDYKQRFRKYGALWSGISLTILSYFILMKGAKGARFLIELGVTDWIFANLSLLLLASLVFWTLVFQIVLFFFKNANVLKFIVLLGTFSLAMAFAANDLVNFIGPTLAGITAYTIGLNYGDLANANMADLATLVVQAETWMLLLAGGVMVLTLYFSKKTRSVIKTSVNLGRQSEGEENFDSNMVARAIVRMVITMMNFIKRITPKAIQNFINNRFDISKYKPELDDNGNEPAFDLLRAAVILIVSSGLISFATSLKLPLSTTYVTFIVAMAAALPDKAWGRDSAVYRVAGVVTVISGWFFTAFMAAIVSAAIAAIIYYGEIYGLAGMVIFTAVVLLRTSKLHKQKENEQDVDEYRTEIEEGEIESDNDASLPPTIKVLTKETSNFLGNTVSIATNSYLGLIEEDIKILKKSKVNSKKVNRKLNTLIKKSVDFIKSEKNDKDFESDILSIISNCQDIADRILTLTDQNYNYLNNNHHRLFPEQKQDIRDLSEYLQELLVIATKVHKNSFNITEDEIRSKELKLKEMVAAVNKNQVMRIKKLTTSLKRNVLILNIINDVDVIGNVLLKVIRTSKRIKLLCISNDISSAK